MGMVEKVARAMARVEAEKRDRDEGGRGGGIEWLVSQTWRLRIPEARAAIEALREPTEEMIDAGVEAKMKLYERLEGEGKNTRVIVVANHPAGTIYEAMIDKALESGE